MKHHYRKNQTDLFKALVHSELLTRYQGSLLGFLWVFLKPLLLFLVLLFVFQIFSQSAEIKSYPLYLLLGILSYNFFSEGTTLGLYAILSKSHILKKVAFDRRLSVYSSVAHATLNYFFSMVIFACFSLYYGNIPGLSDVGLYLYYVLLLILFILGISMILSILVISFRDLASIWEVLVSVLFYLSPIFYPMQIVPQKWLAVYLLNPLTVIISNMRYLIINHDVTKLVPSWPILIEVLLILAMGMLYFNRQSKHVVEKI